MSPITTHVLDVARGRPAASVPVVLEHFDGEWRAVGRGLTDSDGRIRDLLEPGSLRAGQYRIHFDTATYFAGHGTKAFYPTVAITFEIFGTNEHYHVPLLLSPYGYSTYRGS